jgi:ketosteroid isomerase-like protein
VSGSAAEAVVSMYDAFNRGDLATATEALHAQAELHQDPGVVDTGVYHGRDAFARGFALWLREWSDPCFEPLEVGEEEGCVIMRVRVSGTGRASGLRGTVEFFHAWTMREGKPHRCFVRPTREAAIAAARASMAP